LGRRAEQDAEQGQDDEQKQQPAQRGENKVEEQVVFFSFSYFQRKRTPQVSTCGFPEVELLDSIFDVYFSYSLTP